MTVEIIETKKITVKNPILIEGFPGIGLVGTISASYLVDKLKMEPVGYLISSKFPPIAAIHNHIPLHPARIYQSKKYNLLVLFSEFIIPLPVVYELSRAIIAWSKKKKIKQVISLGGIGLRGEQDEVFGIASTAKLLDVLKSNGIKPIKEGATTGVNGVIMAECASNNFPAISLLAESKPEYLDPTAATMVLGALSKITKIPIDTSELQKEASSVEGKMKEILEGAKKSHKDYKEAEQIGPMYG